MSQDQHPYTCDGCGKRRESDTNRWWLVWLAALENRVSDLRVEAFDKCLAIRAWNDAWAKLEHVYHACGQACAQKLVERWLTTGSLEEEKKEAAT